MPRAVLDSSTLISPFLTPKGVVSRLLHAPYRQRYELYLSEAILEEVARTLLTKRSIRKYATDDDSVVHDYLRWLIGRAETIADIPDLRVVEADPKDDIIIATSIAANADFLVTGDLRHLRPIATYQGVQIVTPREFLEALN